MPYRDHFRQPAAGRVPWQSLHSGMLTELVRQLNAILPDGFVALDSKATGGRLEVDVGTYEEDDAPPHLNGTGGGTATAPTVWTPPACRGSFPAVFTDAREVRVYDSVIHGALVAVIELISPSNKDHRFERRAFAAKCAGYLAAGAAVVILDTITTLRANLHNELVRLLGAPDEYKLPRGELLYAAAYRPVRRNDEPAIDLWTTSFAVGDVLPTMPLRFAGDSFVPVDFEAAYLDACRIRKYPG